MAFALFRTESYQRINFPIRTNTQRFCLARAVHYQPAPITPEPDKSLEVKGTSDGVANIWDKELLIYLESADAGAYEPG